MYLLSVCAHTVRHDRSLQRNERHANSSPCSHYRQRGASRHEPHICVRLEHERSRRCTLHGPISDRQLYHSRGADAEEVRSIAATISNFPVLRLT